MKTSQEWIDLGKKVLFGNYSRIPVVPVRGEGCRVWDADGRCYLDFVAGIAVNALGHAYPKVVDAIEKQARSMLHCSNLYNIPPQIELAELLVGQTFADRVFFCNSGAEANEAAIKLARKYSHDTYGKDRSGIVTALSSFHGRTMATLSATGQEKVRIGFDPLVPGFHYVPYGDAAALEAALDDTICAVLLEPIQGEGGVNVPPAGYLQAVRDMCNRRGILLIFDEIQTGCGRTGKLFAHQHEGVEPDIMTLAKGLAGGVPIGAMLAREALAASFGPGTHGSTFGGNPLATAAGCATIRSLLEDGVLDNCVAAGRHLVARLEELRGKYPALVKEVRGRGLLVGMELTVPGAPLVQAALEKGVLLNCTREKVLRFMPPLIVSTGEIDTMITVLDDILAAQQ